ncbi:MAG: isoamylase early set domain-containing protein [Halothiobacillaceae bacterium]
MSLQKKFLKTKPVCKVTFTLPPEHVGEVQTVHLAGDFNSWSMEAHPLKRKKDGSYSITVDLEKDGEYHFKYVVDGEQWLNDDEPDAYAPSPMDPAAENSLIRT